MRILLSSEHRYPAHDGISLGPHPKEFPSGSGHHLHDLLAKGLAELGHEVLYCLRAEPRRPLPAGVRWISEPDPDVDICHTVAFWGEDLIEFMRQRGKPWLTTCHIDRSTRELRGWRLEPNWVFVSQTLARSHNSGRFVWNGLDPADYAYSAAKQDYFLFMSAAERAWDKGLHTALEVSRRTETRLVVAGTGRSYPMIEEIDRACRESGAEYVGDVQGTKKAGLLAGARAMLFPTRLNEAFGLVMVEALLSGTPVICSNRGACPEVISPSVGFVCHNPADYLEAVRRLVDIRPEVCRQYALERFHYHRMTADYLNEYRREIDAAGRYHCAVSRS